MRGGEMDNPQDSRTKSFWDDVYGLATFIVAENAGEATKE